MEACEHIKSANRDTAPRTPEGCEECLKTGDQWVELRLCLTCGHVGCCDSSKNKHATQHFYETKHPVMRSFQPNEKWMWCYVDKVTAE
jgi:CPA1 family monovalent cation:H+ antiporter